jgi:hypothetical protein
MIDPPFDSISGSYDQFPLKQIHELMIDFPFETNSNSDDRSSF